MSGWLVGALPGATVVGLLAGLGVARTPRARAVLVLVVAGACAALSVLHDQQWVRTSYLVLALVSTFASGRLWSWRRTPQARDAQTGTAEAGGGPT